MKTIIKQLSTLLPLLALFIIAPHNLAIGEVVASPDLEHSSSVEERRILSSLLEEKARIAAQKKLLDAKEMELKSLEVEVDKKLNELRRMREEVEELFAKKDTEENARILNLSKVYEKMDPVKAARVIATLETELAVDILANMKQKSAGKILNNLEGEKAATLSVAFSTLQ
jgi:flagellar motility protein MotE (MotC chaperone)